MNHCKNAALLVMDMQNGIVARFHNGPDMLIPVQNAIQAARQHDIPVIFVRIAFSEGYPEIGPKSRLSSRISQLGGMTFTDAATQIHEAVQPLPSEPVVTKFRVSAFAGSTLELILRSNQIDHLILSGISTSGVVLSTLREASDKDFALTVLSDACIDSDPELHRVLIEKLFPSYSDVRTVDEWIDTIS